MVTFMPADLMLRQVTVTTLHVSSGPLLGVTCYSDKNCRGLVSSEQSSTACCNKKFGSYTKKGGSGRCINW